MQCWVYSTVKNDEFRLPYFLTHYQFADRITLFDLGCDDLTYLTFTRWYREHPTCECVWDKGYLDYTHDKIFNTCWQEANGKADWVFLVDIDEFVWHRAFPTYLEACQKLNINCLLTTGYEMVADYYPHKDVPLSLRVRKGVRNDIHSKLAVINPNEIISAGFDCQRIKSCPIARIGYNTNTNDFSYNDLREIEPYPKEILQRYVDEFGHELPARDLLNLHYRFLGTDHIKKEETTDDELRRVWKLLRNQAYNVVV